MSENQYPPTKAVCQLDADSIYLHQTEADLDPLVADGSYLIPAGCVDTEPPQISEGKAARWNGEGWDVIEDHRGKTAYRKADGAAVQIEQVGELPDELTFTQRENEHQTWDAKAKAWVLLPAVAARIKAEQQDEMWERIKQKRHENLRGGVYVESAGKWFHNTDEARQQYTFMRTLPQLPPDLMWKTMGGDFVNLTGQLLDELSLKMLADEQQDFANAERHRVLMEQSDDPETYDYSDGWTEIYKE